MEHASFNPAPVAPRNTPQIQPRLVCQHLSADNNTPASSPECSNNKEDFQRMPLDDEHWTSKEIPERTLCIHEHGLANGSCPYPCPYTDYQIPPYMDSLD